MNRQCLRYRERRAVTESRGGRSWVSLAVCVAVGGGAGETFWRIWLRPSLAGHPAGWALTGCFTLVALAPLLGVGRGEA